MQVDSVSNSGASAVATAYAVQSQQAVQDRQRPQARQEEAGAQPASSTASSADRVTLSAEARQLASGANQNESAPNGGVAPAQDAQAQRENNAAAAKSVTQALNAYQETAALQAS